MVLCSSLLIWAQDKDNDKTEGMVQMTGQVCRSTCITMDAGKSSCNASCKDKSGEVNFVDDTGKVWKINNPKMVKSNMTGKAVKIKCKNMSPDAFDIQHIALANGPG